MGKLPLKSLAHRFNRKIRLHTLSSWLSIFCLCFVIVLPVCTMVYWIFGDASILYSRANLSFQNAGHAINTWQRVGAALVFELALLPLLIGLLHARTSFKLMSSESVFSVAVARHFKVFALCIFITIIASLVAGPVTSLIFTWGNPVAGVRIAIGIGLEHTIGLLLALIIWLVAKIVERAVVLVQENESFV